MPATRMGTMLDGERDALDELASHVIQWFTDKVFKRRRLSVDEITHVLRSVAYHCRTISSVELPYSIWQEYWREAGLSAFHGKQIYDEACSAGIVDEVEPYSK